MENPFKDAEERLVYAKVLDKYKMTLKKRDLAHTDFLDQLRCVTFMQLLHKHGNKDVSITAHGGYDNAERKILIFSYGRLPWELEEAYENITESESSFVRLNGLESNEQNFGYQTNLGHTENEGLEHDGAITPLTITYNEKFSKAPTHRDYLGAVLGLGIDRGKIGDIRIGEDGAIMYALSDIAPFIVENLNQAGRTKLDVKLGDQLKSIESTAKQKRITVASMRADAIISSALNMSRGKSTALIESEKVFVNWKLATKSQMVSVGDTITVRGTGRVTVNAQCGKSKKEKIVLEITAQG